LQRELALTDRGRQHAAEAFERDRYIGAAPVPYEQYLESQAQQSVSGLRIRSTAVRQALSHLVQSDELVSRVGAAIASTSTLLLHGPSGNGKSAIAAAIRQMLDQPIAIPYAVEISGQVVRLYDPRIHEKIPPSENSETHSAQLRPDRRFITCHRPLVTLGSELTLAGLEMGFAPGDGTHTAPPQMKANGGILVVDDLGRQVIRPEELLNRWMSPMATGVDQVTLHTGETIRVPFDVIMVFASNLTLDEIGDEAFLRRLRHKVPIPNPTEGEYREIFRRAAVELEIPLDEHAVEHVIENYYRTRVRELRGAHPFDILRNLRDFAIFEEAEPRATRDALSHACDSYFG
jgi:predicted ATPase with chaperone activity